MHRRDLRVARPQFLKDPRVIHSSTQTPQPLTRCGRTPPPACPPLRARRPSFAPAWPA